MKILHVIPSVGLSRGGTSQAVLGLLQALRLQGADVELATTNDDGEALLDVPLEQKVEYQHIPTWFFPRFSPPQSAIREFAFSKALTAWLWKHIAEYDLVHVHALFSYPSTIAMTIARLKRVPYIHQPHGLLCNWSLQQSKLKKQLYLSLIERDNIRQSRFLQLTSVMEEREMKQLALNVPSVVLPLGVSVADPIPDARVRLRKQLKLPEEQPIILFMSRLHHKKGLEYLVPALGQLANLPFTFVLAGNGTPEYEQEVDLLLNKAGIQTRTYRPGFVTGEFKDLLLQGSDFFALTSCSENFGMVVLEAMAAGLTTILTPGVALASVLEEQQLGYVPALDTNEIRETIRYCLESPDIARAVGDRARRFIFEHYTWDQIAATLAETYQAVLKPTTYADKHHTANSHV
ncbi:MAG: glycosyltransferase [Myxacorys chilensis ATA2-1-KO14]|jgi:glycosyltransferase involved in cell wall biosynthesis|nr:glycosyltransferase [Myxacorys chilensis ATA2-1-KO14]